MTETRTMNVPLHGESRFSAALWKEIILENLYMRVMRRHGRDLSSMITSTRLSVAGHISLGDSDSLLGYLEFIISVTGYDGDGPVMSLTVTSCNWVYNGATVYRRLKERQTRLASSLMGTHEIGYGYAKQ